jgi:hypothetical protein
MKRFGYQDKQDSGVIMAPSSTETAVGRRQARYRVLAFFLLFFASVAGSQENANRPLSVTRCDADIPLRIELIPLTQPRVGRRLQLDVEIESAIDPDLVRSSRIEYEIPRRLSQTAEHIESRDVLRGSRRGRSQVRLTIPDETRFAVRATIVVELVNGSTLSRTSTQWIDLGKPDPPEGMLRRIVDPAGSGIRVYKGTPVREER